MTTNACVCKEESVTVPIRTGIVPGERSPGWSLPRLDGGELGPEQLRGRKALLFFWASW
jgi:hypothetical protein